MVGAIEKSFILKVLTFQGREKSTIVQCRLPIPRFMDPTKERSVERQQIYSLTISPRTISINCTPNN